MDDVLLWKFGGWDSIFVLPTGHSKNGYLPGSISTHRPCNSRLDSLQSGEGAGAELYLSM